MQLLMVRLVLCIFFLIITASSYAAENKAIAYIPGQTTDDFYISVYHGVKRAADLLGIDLIYEGATEWNIKKQIAVLNKVINKNPAVLLISPTDTKQLIEPLKKAHQQGIKIITLDTNIDDGIYQDGSGPGDFPYAHISSDNVYGGRMAAKSLAEAIGKSGTVYIVKGSPATTTEMREYGFKMEMKRYRKINILPTLICLEDPKLAAEQLKHVYAAHPDLNGVFGADLFSAIGVSDGVKEIGRAGSIKVLAFDATERIAHEIREGRIDSAIAQHPEAIGYYGVMCAFGLINDAGSPRSINTGFTVVNKGNIDDPIIQKRIYLTK